MVHNTTKQLLGFLSRRILIASFFFSITLPAFADKVDPFIDDDSLDITHLIQVVLARNPSIEAAQSSWVAAQNRIKYASSLDDPMLSYSFAPDTLGADNLDLGHKIQISQKLPWAGKLALRSDEARFKAQAREEQIVFLKLQLIESTASGFADWYYIHEALRINQIHQDLWTKFNKFIVFKYSAGRTNKQDVLRVEIELTMLEHQKIILLRKKNDFLIKLNSLMNRMPDAFLPPPAKFADIKPLPSVESLRHTALEKNPTLKVLLARKLVSETQYKLAERDYYPDFNVNAGYNSLWNQDEKRLTIGVGINIPIGQSKRDAKVSEKYALSQQLKWQIIDRKNVIMAAVQQAYNNVEESLHILKLYDEKLLKLSEENLQAAQTSYQTNGGDFQDLFNAKKNLIKIQLNHVRVKADYHRHFAILSNRVGDPRILNDEIVISPSLGSFIK